MLNLPEAMIVDSEDASSSRSVDRTGKRGLEEREGCEEENGLVFLVSQLMFRS